MAAPPSLAVLRSSPLHQPNPKHALVMKTDDPLNELLSQWQVRAEPAASFRRNVWQRIEADGAAEPGFWESLAVVFMKPAVLSASFAVALTFGGLISWSTAQSSHRMNPRESYVRSIDPFDSTHLLAQR